MSRWRSTSGSKRASGPQPRRIRQLLVDDLDGTAQRVAGAGFPVSWDDSFPGYRRFHTADGNGNRVEVLSPVTGR